MGIDSRSDKHEKYILMVKAGRVQVDPQELTDALKKK